MDLYQAPEVYEKIIHYDEAKEIQVRLTISTFRGVEYLGVRKYYLDFDESKEVIEEHFSDLIKDLYSK